MRVSVPGIPAAILNAKPTFSINNISDAIERLSRFLEVGNIALLTGAGVSVDSGIRAYRGKDGRYMNPNFKPIFYHELTDATERGHTFRQRYWLRSYLGYPLVRNAQPNSTHFAIAALQYTSYIPWVITQNVDGLHQKAFQQSSASEHQLSTHVQDHILELHGSLHRVHCSKGHIVERNKFQEWLSAANSKWHQYAKELERTNTQPRTNPDGDVDIDHLGLAYRDFIVPECPTCMLDGHVNSVHKPEVVFFGESIPEITKELSHQRIGNCDGLLILGTSLSTYSAFRLLKHALELKKPVLLLNLGPTRADGRLGVEKLDVATRATMGEVARLVIGDRAKEDSVTFNLLQRCRDLSNN